MEPLALAEIIANKPLDLIDEQLDRWWRVNQIESLITDVRKWSPPHCKQTADDRYGTPAYVYSAGFSPTIAAIRN